MTISNYEIMRNRMRDEFLKYDQDKILKKYDLKYDDDYIYIRFVDRDYRVGRKTGIVEGTTDGFVTTFEGDYNESMSIYYVLCYAKDDCRLSGNFCSISMLKGTAQFSNGGIDINQGYARRFSGRIKKLSQACYKIGIRNDLRGDVAATIHPFDFLPVTIQYWDGDEEFAPSLKFMFDENIQDFMHYETIYYMMVHILKRIEELMEEEE